MYFIAKMNGQVIAYGKNPTPGSGIVGADDELFKSFKDYSKKLAQYGFTAVPINLTESIANDL